MVSEEPISSIVEPKPKSKSPAVRKLHPLPLRILHWLNVIAMIVMIPSGWGIYNDNPILPFTFPDWAALGAGAAERLLWHFAGDVVASL